MTGGSETFFNWFVEIMARRRVEAATATPPGALAPTQPACGATQRLRRTHAERPLQRPNPRGQRADVLLPLGELGLVPHSCSLEFGDHLALQLADVMAQCEHLTWVLGRPLEFVGVDRHVALAQNGPAVVLKLLRDLDH